MRMVLAESGRTFQLRKSVQDSRWGSDSTVALLTIFRGATVDDRRQRGVRYIAGDELHHPCFLRAAAVVVAVRDR
jgi:hypothetical protein